MQLGTLTKPKFEIRDWVSTKNSIVRGVVHAIKFTGGEDGKMIYTIIENFDSDIRWEIPEEELRLCDNFAGLENKKNVPDQARG